MKLSELKIGMVVRQKPWVVDETVMIVQPETCQLVTRNERDRRIYCYSDPDGWIIVEPRKKPSHLVRESLVGKIYLTVGGNSAIGGCRESADYANDRIDAILKYLDEKASEQK